MGYYIEADATIVLSNQYTFAELCNSDDLKTLISDGTSLVLNNGSVDLNISNALDYLSRENVYNVKDQHYTKSELQNAGDSTIHYDNVKENP